MKNLAFLLLSLVCLTCPTIGISGELDSYRYTLEQNNDNKVCSHMTHVYNKFFKKPFATSIDEATYEKELGNQFSLLPGATMYWRGFIDMRFSFQPSSPEFDAVKWIIGNQSHAQHHHKGEFVSHPPTPNPYIAADIDINNDGKIETIVKHEFMGCYIPDPRCSLGVADSLTIFRKGDIDLSKGPLEPNVLFKGQQGKAPFAVIYGRESDCSLVRPFVFDGITYISCYSQLWTKDFADYRNKTPEYEYTDVLKYQMGEALPNDRNGLKVETICKFRMKVTRN